MVDHGGTEKAGKRCTAEGAGVRRKQEGGWRGELELGREEGEPRRHGGRGGERVMWWMSGILEWGRAYRGFKVFRAFLQLTGRGGGVDDFWEIMLDGSTWSRRHVQRRWRELFGRA